MEIKISQLSSVLKSIANELDNEGNQNGMIDGGELSVFKAASAFMVKNFKASDIEYTSIFGQSAFTEWKETHYYYSDHKDSHPVVEYADKDGNIMRGSLDKNNDIGVYTEGKNGQKGYYSKEIVMLPEED